MLCEVVIYWSIHVKNGGKLVNKEQQEYLFKFIHKKREEYRKQNNRS
jgi:hypothetical protein